MEGVPSEFNYFEPPLIQSTVLETYDDEVQPITQVQSTNLIQFRIPPSADLYRDLNNSKIEVKCQVVTSEDKALANVNTVAPVNLLLHSLFNNVKMRLQGRELPDSNGLYAYRAMLGTILTYRAEVLDTRLDAEGWEKDTSGSTDVTSVASDTDNKGAALRADMMGKSKVVTLIGRPHLDLFNQPKCIPGSCEIELDFTLNDNKFLLMNKTPGDTETQDNYKVKILQARMLIATKRVSPSLVMAHEKMQLTRNMRIDFTEVQMRKHTIASGVNSYTWADMMPGTVPDRLAIAFVADEASVGSYTTNPYHFENLDIREMYISFNGRTYPAFSLTPNFTTGDYLREYMYTLSALGLDEGNQMIDLAPDEWANGYTIFVFKLTPARIGTVRSAPLTGSINLTITFGTATAKTYKAIVSAEVPATLEIDKFKQVVKS